MREALGFVKVRDNLGLTAAIANLAGIAPEDARDEVIEELNKQFNTTVVPLTLGKR
jgi:hypothetical protein